MAKGFRTWNVRSLCRAGSKMTVLGELPKYKSDLVGVTKSDGRAVALN
jgi:hypothetical protein